MLKNRMVYSVAAIIAVVGFVSWKMSRGAYESAPYTVVASERSFELREYPHLMVATTESRMNNQGEDGSFMQLFRYISGGNEAKQKIAMTTPVFMDAPSYASRGQMGFVLPADVAASNVPAPASANVAIRERQEGRFAVVRFSGRINANSFQRAETRLRSWIADSGWSAEGNAELAGYDPPWTPGPFRRNEVLIRVGSSEQTDS